MKPHATSLLVVILAGCGTRTLEDLSSATPPLAVYTRDEKACAVAANGAPEDELRTGDAGGESTAVVEVGFANECSGLGGQYVLARTVDGSRYFWLGAHGCATWETPPLAKFGVVRYSTAAAAELPDGACLTMPGAPAKITSDASVRAIAVFATRSEAERFKSRL
jgi:hypothetical protein